MSIKILGIGMGSINALTLEGYEVLKSADVLIGSQRAVESLKPKTNIKMHFEVVSSKIAEIIKQYDRTKSIVVLMSGDTGFYSGCTALCKLLDDNVKILPGVSSVSYMAAKIKRPWQNVRLVSAHGKQLNILGELLSNKEIFFLLGGKITAETIIKTAFETGLKETVFFVGERLSYDDETITKGTALELIDKSFNSLSVVWAISKDESNDRLFLGEISDNVFLREKVPMTKQEIRCLILRKLNLNKNNIVYDIGGGTGSVSVSIALSSPFLKVFSVEAKKNAYELILKNKELHKAYNLKVVFGKAPEAIKDLPVPDAVFIGGSNGKLEAVIKSILDKNPNVRIVISAVTIETLSLATKIFKTLNIAETEIIEVSVSKTQKLGSYNLLTAQNPVFLISGGGIDEDRN